MKTLLCNPVTAVAVIPEKLQTVWDWSEWGFNRSNGQVVNRTDQSELIPFNYIIFGVSPYEGP